MTTKFSKGFAAFYLVMVVLSVSVSIAGGLYLLLGNKIESASSLVKSSQALVTAEAGLEDAVLRIVKNKKQEANYNFALGQASVALNITSQGNQKLITAVGSILQRSRKLVAVLTTENSTLSFHYGAQVGKGGLTMGDNAKVLGNVYSNGSISSSGGGSGGAAITGDVWVAGSVSPLSDQEWQVKNQEFAFGLKRSGIYYLDTAQSFTPSVSNVLRKISFYLKKVGSPPDQTIRILADNSGSPSRTVLGNGTLRSTSVANDFSWVDVNFNTPPALGIGQPYWLMIDVSRDDNNYWVWGADSNNGYARGVGKYTNDWSSHSAVWNDVGADLDFKTYMGGEAPTYIDGLSVGVDAHANTITDSAIGRDAYFQSIDQGTTVQGSKYPNSEDPALKDLPISLAQIQAWENQAQSGGINQGDLWLAPGEQVGPLKIEGDLHLPSADPQNPAFITGPVWVAGNIYGSGNGKVKLDDNLTSGYPVIADNPDDQNTKGKVILANNFIAEDSTAGGYLLFVSMNKSLDKDNPAISIFNNVNKDNPGAIIFALQGLINMANNGKFKEISGYALNLENNTQIVYEQGLIDANFSSGPGAGWKVESWQETQ